VKKINFLQRQRNKVRYLTRKQLNDSVIAYKFKITIDVKSKRSLLSQTSTIAETTFLEDEKVDYCWNG